MAGRAFHRLQRRRGLRTQNQGEFRQFVSQATGSAFELEWHVTIAFGLGYMVEGERDEMIAQIGIIKKLLYRFGETLR